MEAKDWLSLLVSIIFNGLFLFLFQQAIVRNNKRAERRTDYQYQTLTHFLELLQRFYTAFRVIQDVDTTVSGKQISFADAWNPAAELMQQLVSQGTELCVSEQQVSASPYKRWLA